MSTIITRNSATSGSTPSSLVQGELAINVTDGRLFYGSGSGNTVKEFGTTASYALQALSASYAVSASYEITYETSSSYADFAAQAGNAAAIDIFSFSSPVDSYLLMSNVIAATGVAVGGDTDLRYNSSTNTLTAVNISATSITGSLLGTASYASQALSASHAITSSYPIAASSSTIYSVIPPALSSGKNNAILLGASAGTGTTTIYNSNFIGYGAGGSATNSYQSNFIGTYAGNEAISADNSNFIGLFAGYKAVSASFSTLIGWQAGYTSDSLTSIGTNNIVIGTNITLPSKSRDSINLGGIIFATGSYSSIAGNPYSGSQYNIGRVGINKVTPNYTLDVSGSGNYSNGLTVTGSVIATSFTGSLLGTASYAIQALSSSYALTASYVNPLRQDVQITGSLNITGSTTQIGNNTLLGSTTLSGSIIISGSTTTPSTPTIKIYGDMETNGVIKFNPVVKNIDTSISASYIYVSGSTNDLYFSQNGSGYANTTRLRWLEGNLYTGLLNGGLITSASSNTFNISSGSGIIVNLNASLNNNPYPTIQYVNWGNLTNQPLTYLTSSIQTFVGINSSGTVIQQTDPWNDGQYNTSLSIGTVLHQNTASINGTISYPNVAYGWKQRSYDFIKAFGPLKLSGYTIFTSSSLGLTVGSGTAWADGRNYQTDPNNPSYITDSGTNVSKIFRYHVSASTYIQDTNGGVGYTVIDPAQYNNNGVLTPISPSTPWSNQRVFYYPNSVTKGIVVYYGSATYASQTEAVANLQYENFQETPNTQQNAIYLGTITIKYNGTFTTPADYTILPGGIFRNVGGSGGGGTVSSTLAGLSDVSITGPTNGQPLVYNSASLKWENQSTLTANLIGNASTATSASYSQTSSYASQALSASYALNATTATTASYVLNAISASFATLAQTANTASYVVTAQTASYVLNAVSASFAVSSSRAVSASFATTASYVLNAISASFASTASSVNTLNQNVLITGSLTVGATTSGVSENTLTLGPRDNGSEGGQLMLQAPGGTYTSASMWDNYANQTRLLRGSNAGSDALVASFNMHTKQVSFPQYNSPTAFTGTTLVGLLGFDNSGNLITTTTSSGGGGGGVTITNNVDNYVITATGTANTINGESNMQFNGSSLSITGEITSSGAIRSLANGAMYFRGGDDAEFWDINVANTVGIYGQQTQTVAGLKLGSAGATLYGSGSRFGIGTLSPVATLDVNGNLFVASGITGSLQGTASYATQALSSSFASTASYVLQAVSASFATLAQTANTASYVLNAVSSSFASTASFVQNAQTASYVLQAVSASFATSSSRAVSASFATTASYVLQAVSASFATLAQTANTASYVITAQTASYVNPLMQNVIVTGSLTSTANIQANKFVFTDGVINTNVAGQNMFAVGGNYLYLYTGTNGLNIVNQANSANNLTISDTGVVQTRGSITAGSPGNDQSIYFGGTNAGLYWAGSGASIAYSVGALQFSSVGSPNNMVLASGGGATFNYGITGSLLGTATTASYVLNAVSASFATSASRAVSASFSTTASYAIQALSASYAPDTTFPYNGDAQISGSLGVTGSFNVQTYDGVLANAFIPAIEITNTKRNIYDTFGSSSINADGRLLIGNTGAPALSWISRTVFDSVAVQSMDWNQRFLYDITGNSSVDWNNRTSYDSLGNSSINWNNRSLLDSSNTAVVSWDAFALNYKVETYTYLKRFIDSTTQESFSNVPTVAFNYEGEVIQATLDGTVNQFDLVYLETDGKWYPVSQGTADCTKLLGICAETGIRPKVILEGSITVNDGTFTDTPLVQNVNFGLPIYIRETSGFTMSTVVPTTTGQYVRVLGHVYYQNTIATNYWTMKFRPSNEWYVI